MEEEEEGWAELAGGVLKRPPPDGEVNLGGLMTLEPVEEGEKKIYSYTKLSLRDRGPIPFL